jgi:transposase
MNRFAGLDVSVKDTSICILDESGEIVREDKVPTEPEAIIAVLRTQECVFKRIGLEAGPLSQWLYTRLAKAGMPAICVETRHMKAALSAERQKTDRNDARGIAQMMRVGLYQPVHVKTQQSQEKRVLLTSRKLLQRKLLDIENELRGILRNFGLKVGPVRANKFEGRIRDLVEDHPRLAKIVEPILIARQALREQFNALHKILLELVRDDDVCRLLMTAPGVGPVVALTYRATVDVPARFGKSKAVGAHYGLTPRRYQSGEIDRMGRISKCGDGMLRTALYEAAQVLMVRTRKWCSLKAWGMQIARRRGMQKAIVAVARRLAVILHRMWRDGTEFHWGRHPKTA